jgi:hypothetical protein
VCKDGVNTHTCTCSAGWSGADCKTNIDDCVGQTCSAHGGCVDEVNAFKCNCATGYTGVTCETAGDCATGPDGACPCENNGAATGCTPATNSGTTTPPTVSSVGTTVAIICAAGVLVVLIVWLVVRRAQKPPQPQVHGRRMLPAAPYADVRVARREAAAAPVYAEAAEMNGRSTSTAVETVMNAMYNVQPSKSIYLEADPKRAPIYDAGMLAGAAAHVLRDQRRASHRCQRPRPTGGFCTNINVHGSNYCIAHLCGQSGCNQSKSSRVTACATHLVAVAAFGNTGLVSGYLYTTDAYGNVPGSTIPIANHPANGQGIRRGSNARKHGSVYEGFGSSADADDGELDC